MAQKRPERREGEIIHHRLNDFISNTVNVVSGRHFGAASRNHLTCHHGHERVFPNVMDCLILSVIAEK